MSALQAVLADIPTTNDPVGIVSALLERPWADAVCGDSMLAVVRQTPWFAGLNLDLVAATAALALQDPALPGVFLWSAWARLPETNGAAFGRALLPTVFSLPRALAEPRPGVKSAPWPWPWPLLHLDTQVVVQHHTTGTLGHVVVVCVMGPRHRDAAQALTALRDANLYTPRHGNQDQDRDRDRDRDCGPDLSPGPGRSPDPSSGPDMAKELSLRSALCTVHASAVRMSCWDGTKETDTGMCTSTTHGTAGAGAGAGAAGAGMGMGMGTGTGRGWMRPILPSVAADTRGRIRAGASDPAHTRKLVSRRTSTPVVTGEAVSMAVASRMADATVLQTLPQPALGWEVSALQGSAPRTALQLVVYSPGTQYGPGPTPPAVSNLGAARLLRGVHRHTYACMRPHVPVCARAHARTHARTRAC
jgi:hypothetical protein